MELPFGHVSIMGSERAKNTVWKTCVDWLKTRSGEMVNCKGELPTRGGAAFGGQSTSPDKI